MAVRAVRRVRAALPRSRDGTDGARPTGVVPRLAQRDRRVERERLRLPPDAPRPRAPIVVLARDVRDRRVPGGRRDGTRHHAAGGRRDPAASRSRVAARAGALRRALPAHGLGTGRLRDLVAPAPRRPDRVRPADVMARGKGRATVLRQPEDHAGPRPGGARNDDLNRSTQLRCRFRTSEIASSSPAAAMSWPPMMILFTSIAGRQSTSSPWITNAPAGRAFTPKPPPVPAPWPSGPSPPPPPAPPCTRAAGITVTPFFSYGSPNTRRTVIAARACSVIRCTVERSSTRGPPFIVRSLRGCAHLGRPTSREMGGRLGQLPNASDESSPRRNSASGRTKIGTMPTGGGATTNPSSAAVAARPSPTAGSSKIIARGIKK